jgi:CBS domain containing-hemolysin-like protein
MMAADDHFGLLCLSCLFLFSAASGLQGCVTDCSIVSSFIVILINITSILFFPCIWLINFFLQFFTSLVHPHWLASFCNRVNILSIYHQVEKVPL